MAFSFLKQIGQILTGKWGRQVPPPGAARELMKPGPVSLSQLVDLVVTVETVGQVLSLPGPEKLKAATPLVMQALLTSGIVPGARIKDLALLERAAAEIAGGIADFLNAIAPQEAGGDDEHGFAADRNRSGGDHPVLRPLGVPDPTVGGAGGPP